VHSDGAYVRGEAQLSGTAERGTRGFARIGVADGQANPFSGFVSGGLVWRGLMRQRPQDETGIMFAYALAGSATRRLSRDAIGVADRGELVFEFTHRIKLADWISIQPDVQYVVNPGLDPALKNALAVGFRLSTSLGL
jgi:porin